MKLPNFDRIEPISLDNLPPYFAIISSYKGRDILTAYANRAKGMELYSIYISGLYNEKQNRNILSPFNKLKDEPVNLVFSSKAYPNINDENTIDKSSRLVLIWNGYCTTAQRRKIQNYFDLYSDDIFKIIQNLYLINSKKVKLFKNNEEEYDVYVLEEKLKLSLEEYIAILVYQAMNYSEKNKSSMNKRLRKIYIIIILYMVSVALILIYFVFFKNT